MVTGILLAFVLLVFSDQGDAALDRPAATEPDVTTSQFLNEWCQRRIGCCSPEDQPRVANLAIP